MSGLRLAEFAPVCHTQIDLNVNKILLIIFWIQPYTHYYWLRNKLLIFTDIGVTRTFGTHVFRNYSKKNVCGYKMHFWS